MLNNILQNTVFAREVWDKDIRVIIPCSQYAKLIFNPSRLKHDNKMLVRIRVWIRAWIKIYIRTRNYYRN